MGSRPHGRGGRVLGQVRNYLAFCFHAFALTPRVLTNRYRLQEVVAAVDAIGIRSFPVVGLTGLIAGLLISRQSLLTVRTFQVGSLLGQFVAVAIIREMAPVFGSFMVAARIGAGLTSELATMRTNQLIDAMWTLRRDPLESLVTTRIIGSLIALPVAVILAAGLGIFGGMIVAMSFLGQTPSFFLANVRLGIGLWDVIPGLLIKPMVFGLIIATISCFYGYRASGGTREIGRATTRAVVTILFSIILGNFALSQLIITLRSP